MIARQLAVLAGGAGPSYLIDRDPQATTTKWWSRRAEFSPALDKPELVNLDGATPSDAAVKLRSRPGVAFVDTRPAVEEPEAEASGIPSFSLRGVKARSG